MTAQTTRILKESRPLFWPWCAVVLAGALPLLNLPYSIARISSAVFWLGTWLLASLAVGNEFQHRTLSLMLSQPVSRTDIWREKLGVTVAAVVSAAVIYFPAQVRSLHLGARGLWEWWAVLLALTVSAAFWTLFARSTLGGVALNLAAFLVIFTAWNYVFRGHGRSVFSPTSPTGVLSFGGTFLCYGGVMLWLGWRKLARFEVTGAASGDDLLTAGPDVVPGALAGWLRSRPTGAVFNLIRKEIRLLRPVWLMTVLAAVGWTGLTVDWSLHYRAASTNFQFAVVGVGVICTLLVAILAGSVSLGEEKTSGTHAWHLTVPVPSLVQWGVKLMMALFAGFLGAWLVPALVAGRSLFISSHLTLAGRDFGTVSLIAVLLLTFVTFWCACAVDGTVAAALWVVPVAVVLGLANYLALQWGEGLLRFVSTSLSANIGALGSSQLALARELSDRVSALFGNLRLDWWVTRIAFPHNRFLNLFETGYVLLAGAPALVLALVQSYRLFRMQPCRSARAVARKLLPLAMLVFLGGFSLTVLDGLQWVVGLQTPLLVETTNRAIDKALPGAAQAGVKPPLQLTLDDVVKAWRTGPEFHRLFPATTRRWLTGARITVYPGKDHPDSFYCEDHPWGYGMSHTCYYSAMIDLADGTAITESYDPAPDGGGFLWLRHLSVRVRWPGAARDEPLWER